ncbi:bZIP transcription factor 23 isoform X1 [Nymphaea colorata]|nr:bZIP transcription factor 23 isoform X1 [Nymphaea colorata]
MLVTVGGFCTVSGEEKWWTKPVLALLFLPFGFSSDECSELLDQRWSFEVFFQSSGLGKDFGSMNMDEFLKSVCFAEDTQGFGTPLDLQEGNSGSLGRQPSLQRQGSLTLPRTLSLKTVDEVFKDMFRESVEPSGNLNTPFPQRQQTLGEMTLEEFLVRAGVVREGIQSAANSGLLLGNYGTSMGGNSATPVQSDVGLVLGFGQSDQTNGNLSSMAYQGIVDSSASSMATLEGIRSQSQQQPQLQQQQQQLPWLNSRYNQSPVVQQPKPQENQLFHKQSIIGFAPPVQISNNVDMKNPSIGSSLSLSQVGGISGNGAQVGSAGVVGIADSKAGIAVVSSSCNGYMKGGIQGGGGISVTSLGAPGGAVTTAARASPLSSEGLNKSDGDNSSLSPVPYTFGGGLRGRKGGGPLEKVVERRQRRMIKNRESAARSRARKQAYTMELEAEVAKLKDENMKLQKKQAEIVEMQKAQVLEKLSQQAAPKKRCLRRTSTGPW